MAKRVLVVDDERDLVDLLEYNLRQAGFQVATAFDGSQAVETARREPPDLMLLDLMLPDLSGTEVLKILRARETTRSIPVILLTARKDEVDRLVGFELGADDYVTKPFSIRELILRVRAVLRRGAAAQPAPGGADRPVLRAGPITVNQSEFRVLVDGSEVALTVTEFKLLADLIRAGGRVRTRDALLAEVWGYNADVMSRTVDTHVRRLRDKLGAASVWVKTVRGIGYRMKDPDHERT